MSGFNTFLLQLFAVPFFSAAQEGGMVTDYLKLSSGCTAAAAAALPASVSALRAAAVAQYRHDGYYVARGLLSAQEVALVKQALEQDPSLKTNMIELGDEQGGATRFSLWSNPGNGTLGALTRSSRVVQSMRLLLGGEVLHYHSKSLTKHPKAGGAWTWHQDYGYWYKVSTLVLLLLLLRLPVSLSLLRIQDFFLLPDLSTAYFAIDRQTPQNGAFTVLKGSHALGRIDHGTIGDQQGADLERVELAKARYEELVLELDPGDCVFFDALLLHTSKGNFSPSRRMAFASVFTRADNIQWKKPYIPCWKVDEVSDGLLLEKGVAIESAVQKVMLGSEEGKAAGAKRKDGSYEEALDSIEKKLETKE